MASFWQQLSAALALFLSLPAVYSDGLATVPLDLKFDCNGRSYGYYADPEADCQVFHICLGEGPMKWSFLCPNFTLFNQQYFICDNYYNVDCALAQDFYYLNENFGRMPEPKDEDQDQDQRDFDYNVNNDYDDVGDGEVKTYFEKTVGAGEPLYDDLGFA